MTMGMIIGPDDQTERMVAPRPGDVDSRADASDTEDTVEESDGVPRIGALDELAQTTLSTTVSVPVVDGFDATPVAGLTLRQKVAVLWQLQGAADRAHVYFEIDPKSTSVEILCNHWRRLCSWLCAQDALDFRDVHVDLVLRADLYEAGLLFLRALAREVPRLSAQARSRNAYTDSIHVYLDQEGL